MDGNVIEKLAATYQQLYIEPGEDAYEKYADVVKRGHEIKDGNLDHFVTDERDRLEYMDTPAGKVCVVTLYNRKDFITFLQIMANRCAPVAIPDTQGASIISGVINWEKIRSHEEEYIAAEKEKGNPDPDVNAEFVRFTSDKKNYLDTLIILSVGPYSGISFDRAGVPETEWISRSYEIRKYHECTHFICQKKYPDKKDAIWDELVADAVGIYGAFGNYDPEMEMLFLGIEGGRYTGGRLENYIKAETDEEKLQSINEMTGRIIQVLSRFEEIISDNKGLPPFDIAVKLEESMDELWNTPSMDEEK